MYQQSYNAPSNSLLIPVIQGTLDVEKEVPRQEIVKALEFCTNLFNTSWNEEAGIAVLEKIHEGQKNEISGSPAYFHLADSLRSTLTADEKVALDYIELTKSMRWNENITAETIASDIIEGRKFRLERGKLGLELV